MALKLFAKQTEVEVNTEVAAQDNRVARLEKQVDDMAHEMSKMKNEFETIVARQQGFRLALRRLREYLEERGVQERSASEVKDDNSAPASLQSALARKDRSNMN